MAAEQSPFQYRATEAGETLVARNLIAARIAASWTQEALSAASGVSRATIAQLETGVSDPRLSTLAALAKAFGFPLLLLLIGETEVRTLAQLVSQPPSPPILTSADVRKVQRYLSTGMLRDRADAMRLVSERLKEVAAAHPLATLTATLFAGFIPDPGATLGAAWGNLLAAGSSAPPEPPGGPGSKP